MFAKAKRFFMIAMACCVISSTCIPSLVYADTTTVSSSTTNNTVQSKNSDGEETVVIVSKPSPRVTISATSMTVARGKKTSIAYTVMYTSKSNIAWSSSNKKVATVSSSGTIYAKKSGTATITARVKGTKIKDTIKITSRNYYTMRVRTTGYCNCRLCCGKWAGGATASGKKPKANHTIAVDPRVIKLGTKVQIGNIIYTAEDTGSAIKGRRIDVYYSSHRRAQAHGVKYQTIRVFY